MTDETTRLRDALLDDITYPARFDALPPDRCGDLAARLDALIAAVRAETLAGPGVVETPETAFEALRPRTRAGWALLGREALNSRSFALINAADIVAIEQEALALAATPPAPAVEQEETVA